MQINNVTMANGKDSVSTLGFTKDQRAAYDELINFINAPYDKSDYKRALIGPAGTGKTYLVKALIKNCNKSYSTIGLAAPTHKACRVLQESIQIPNIKCNTIQSDLGLRLNFDVDKFDISHPPYDPRGKIKIGNYKIYIVDEASMINRGLATFLEQNCRSKECKIIYIGDASQLAPVGERYSPCLRGLKSHRLNEIVRQEKDNPILGLLDLLRFDIEHKSFTFLEYISKNRQHFDSDNIKGYRVCTPSEFEQIVYNNFSDKALETHVDYAKVVAYTNINVSSWNKFIRNAIIKNANTSVLTKNDLIISYTTIVNKFNEPVIKNSEEYIVYDIANYTHPDYNIRGFMVRFQAIHGGKISSPLFVLDHNDLDTIQTYVRVCNNMIDSAKNSSQKLRPQRWKEYYEFRESCLLLTNIVNRDGSTKFSRDLDYGFALTSHKSQGSTFDTSLVDVNDIVFDKYGNPYTNAEEINRRLYVACSRCKNKLYLKYGK